MTKREIDKKLKGYYPGKLSPEEEKEIEFAIWANKKARKTAALGYLIMGKFSKANKLLSK